MNWDASRVSAAIPSGVGFLGAGLIYQGGGEIIGNHGHEEVVEEEDTRSTSEGRREVNYQVDQTRKTYHKTCKQVQYVYKPRPIHSVLFALH